MCAWKVLDEQYALNSDYLKVLLQRVEVEPGTVIDDFHLLRSPSWAACVCLTEAEELVLVEQYRHGHGGTSLELPAGVIDPGEVPLEAARRELEEETGYSPAELVPLWKVRPEPARHDQWAHIAFARGARPSGVQKLDEAERIRIVLRPAAELDAILEQMVHATHVGALLLAARRGLLPPGT